MTGLLIGEVIGIDGGLTLKFLEVVITALLFFLMYIVGRSSHPCSLSIPLS